MNQCSNSFTVKFTIISSVSWWNIPCHLQCFISLPCES